MGEGGFTMVKGAGQLCICACLCNGVCVCNLYVNNPPGLDLWQSLVRLLCGLLLLSLLFPAGLKTNLESSLRMKALVTTAPCVIYPFFLLFPPLSISHCLLLFSYQTKLKYYQQCLNIQLLKEFNTLAHNNLKEKIRRMILKKGCYKRMPCCTHTMFYYNL